MRPAELFYLFSSVTGLRGVGKGSADALSRLLSRRHTTYSDSPEEQNNIAANVPNEPRIKDLLFHLPTQLIDRSKSPPIDELQEGQIVTLVVRILSHHPPPAALANTGRRRAQYRKIPYKVTCANDSGEIVLTFFNSDKNYLQRKLPVGENRVISGKVEIFDGTWQMAHPDIIAPVSAYEKIKSFEPVYPLTWGVTNKRIQSWIEQILDNLPELKEWIDKTYLKVQGWSSWKDSLVQLHNPSGEICLSPSHPARQRLAYDEALAGQLALMLVRNRIKRRSTLVVPYSKDDNDRNKSLTQHINLPATIEASLPFSLTKGQREVIDEIRTDMASSYRMLRLLQGDVGSGKTVVALLSALAVVEHGMQAAIMAPTEILARQHYETISKLLAKYNSSCHNADKRVNLTLLTGSLSAQEKKAALSDIASGSTNIIIGTHALFQQSVKFHKLAFVVIDEQHRFGVQQRMALVEKGNNPHLLLMTATPIPRSLTMVMYGDMDNSCLAEKPKGRIEIKTSAINMDRIDEVASSIKRALDRGEKIYWVCPLIEESEEHKESDANHTKYTAAEERYLALQKIYGDKVGLVHGRMKAEERHREMQRFLGTEIDILVATTVIEVGVDVKDATIIIIENAERFGLSQLHQLRGRVGRGDKPSFCILLYNKKKCSEIGYERLKIIRNLDDGFRIAEEDLRLRGSGDILGTKQSGIPEFTFIDIYEHRELIKTARDDAKLIVNKDEKLESDRGKALRNLLYMFEHDKSIKLTSCG